MIQSLSYMLIQSIPLSFQKVQADPLVCTLMRSLEVTYFLFLGSTLDKSTRSVIRAPESIASATLSLLTGSIVDFLLLLIKNHNITP